MSEVVIRRALLSVSDKTGLVEFARFLHQQQVEIISTGGTYQLLLAHQIPAREVSDYTGFPEMMDGRLKTLHPKIHGGLLGRRGQDEAVMVEHAIEPIDLVVVNLYPFAQTIAKVDCDLDLAIENIDIGGPTMLRAAAKNHASVLVVVDPNDYQRVCEEMTSQHGAVSHATRFDLAVKTFEQTAQYDGMIANALGAYLESNTLSGSGRTHTQQWHKQQDLRYGENPHQQAAFYVDRAIASGTLAAGQQLVGKALSYNNIADADAALECVKSFDMPACVIVKHANPCGVAVDADIFSAYQRAYQTDPTSAFGGIIAFNRPLDERTAQAIIQQQFVEVIIAPQADADAINIVKAKPNVRLVVVGECVASTGRDGRIVRGGLLVQDLDTAMVTLADLKVVSKRQPTDAERIDLLFAWKVAKYVKSNAIVYGRDQMTIGIGAGQMSRVYSAKIAAIKAADEGLVVAGSVMASDAFFPFRDGIDAAHQAGVCAVVQPGGSMRDQEVIDAANEHNMAMVFTGLRHFRH